MQLPASRCPRHPQLHPVEAQREKGGVAAPRCSAARHALGGAAIRSQTILAHRALQGCITEPCITLATSRAPFQLRVVHSVTKWWKRNAKGHCVAAPRHLQDGGVVGLEGLEGRAVEVGTCGTVWKLERGGGGEGSGGDGDRVDGGGGGGKHRPRRRRRWQFGPLPDSEKAVGDCERQ